MCSTANEVSDGQLELDERAQLPESTRVTVKSPERPLDVPGKDIKLFKRPVHESVSLRPENLLGSPENTARRLQLLDAAVFVFVRLNVRGYFGPVLHVTVK